VNNFKKILDLLKRKGFCHYEPAVGGRGNLLFNKMYRNPYPKIGDCHAWTL